MTLELLIGRRIERKAKELYSELKSREEQFMEENDIVSSLLCEVDRLNLLNLLKVFEVEVDLELGEVKDEDVDKETGNDRDKENQETTDLRRELSRLQEEHSRSLSDLIVKVNE